MDSSRCSFRIRAQPAQVGAALRLQLGAQPRRASLAMSILQALRLWLLLTRFRSGNLWIPEADTYWNQRKQIRNKVELYTTPIP